MLLKTVGILSLGVTGGGRPFSGRLSTKCGARFLAPSVFRKTVCKLWTKPLWDKSFPQTFRQMFSPGLSTNSVPKRLSAKFQRSFRQRRGFLTNRPTMLIDTIATTGRGEDFLREGNSCVEHPKLLNSQLQTITDGSRSLNLGSLRFEKKLWMASNFC